MDQKEEIDYQAEDKKKGRVEANDFIHSLSSKRESRFDSMSKAEIAVERLTARGYMN